MSEVAIAMDQMICRRKDLVASQMDDEIVMLDMESGQYFGMNPIASAIWEKLEQPITLFELCEKLMVEFEVEPEQCKNDVSQFVEQLVENKLLEVCE